MPKYKVQTNNETAQTVAIKYYGTPSKEDLIIKANPFIESIISAGLFLPRGSVLTIPQEVKPLPKKIPVTPKPEPVIEPEHVEVIENEEVALVIDGTLFKFWENADITLPFDSMRSFSLSCPFDAINEIWQKLFQPFKYQTCALYVGGVKVITASAIKIDTDSSSSADKLQLSGYSICAIIQDCPPSPSSYPLTFSGLNLKQIAEKLCKPFNFKVVFEDDPGASFKGSDKIEIEPDKKIFDFLSELAKQRGLIIGDDADGNLVFKKATSERAKFSLVNKQYPVTGSSFNFDGQKRFSEITILNGSKGSGSGAKYTIADNELKRNGIFRPTVVKNDDIEQGGIKKAAISQWGRNLSDSFSGSISCVGWRTPRKELFKPNTRLMYSSPENLIFSEIELLIREVRLTKSSNSVVSSLTAIMPESYLNEQPEKMPWEK